MSRSTTGGIGNLEALWTSAPVWWLDSRPPAVSVGTLVILLAVVAAVETVNQEDS